MSGWGGAKFSVFVDLYDGGPHPGQPYDQETEVDVSAGDQVTSDPARYSTLDRSPDGGPERHSWHRSHGSENGQRRSDGHRQPSGRGSSRGSLRLSRKQEHWSVRWPE